MKLVLELGVHPDRIIYANPCKMLSHLKFAAENNVSLMTFDNLSELHKVKKHFPSAKYVNFMFKASCCSHVYKDCTLFSRLVIRLAVENKDATKPFGDKFGCSLTGAKELLNQAQSMGLIVVGVRCVESGSCNMGIDLFGGIFTDLNTLTS